jgi:nucleoside-diphosphate-sugar epimerase
VRLRVCFLLLPLRVDWFAIAAGAVFPCRRGCGRRRWCVTALRYHNVYGPRMRKSTPYAGVASILRSALEHHTPPLVFEDGNQTRDFVDVRDVARANVLALTADPSMDH